jgi:hypothetical protein
MNLEHFSHRKLWQRNPDEDMVAGQYTMDIFLSRFGHFSLFSNSFCADYPVVNYSGTKSVVFSTVSWIGGRNPFLGIAYLVVAGLCILIGLALLMRHVLKPRKLGDMSYLIRFLFVLVELKLIFKCTAGTRITLLGSPSFDSCMRSSQL